MFSSSDRRFASVAVMAVAQRRFVELRRISTDAEYRAALARIEQLVAADDLESVGELEALANYVEAWERVQPAQPAQPAQIE